MPRPGRPDPLDQAKRDLRAALLAVRRGTPLWLRRRRSRAIIRRLAVVSAWTRARRIFAYAAVGAEADPAPLLRVALRAGRTVAFPRVGSAGRLEFHRVASLDDLAPGAFGIPEPAAVRGSRIAPGRGDLVLVPGVGFAPDGTRLGRGGGHYDRALARRAGAVAIGLGFEAQVVPALPWGGHDTPLDALVTDQRARFFGAIRTQSRRSSAMVPPTKNWATASPWTRVDSRTTRPGSSSSL